MFAAFLSKMTGLLGGYATPLRRSALMMLQRSDRGDVQGAVPTIVIIAGFALIAFIIGIWLDTATTNKTADTAVCVESAQHSYGGSSQGKCDPEHVQTDSFTQDSSYTSRY